jgi:hypothetical protein
MNINYTVQTEKSALESEEQLSVRGVLVDIINVSRFLPFKLPSKQVFVTTVRSQFRLGGWDGSWYRYKSKRNKLSHI